MAGLFAKIEVVLITMNLESAENSEFISSTITLNFLLKMEAAVFITSTHPFAEFALAIAPGAHPILPKLAKANFLAPNLCNSFPPTQ